MSIYDHWEKALRGTEIVRSRVQGLLTFADTHVPYIFLAESDVNQGDTVVRKGKVVVQKPSIILPPNMPQLEGFEWEDPQPQDEFLRFLLLRGVSVPSLHYNNKTHSIDIHEGQLSEALRYYEDFLQRQEDVHTGLIVGPEDCWQFSVLIFICSQVARNAETDIRRLLEEYRKRQS